MSQTSPIIPALPSEQVSQRAIRGKRGVLLIAVLGLLTGGGYTAMHLLDTSKVSTDDAMVEADVVPLAARVGGQVAKVLVTDNARVKAGDVLLQLDIADLTARVKQAESELDAAKAQAQMADAQAQVAEAGARGGLSSAKAQVTTTVAQVSSANAQIETAQAQLQQAEANARRATLELERVKKLHEVNAISQEALDNTQASADASQAAWTAAKAQVAAAEKLRRVAQSRVAEANGLLDVNTPVDAKVGAAQASAQLAHARVGTAEAALDLARLNLSWATVSAPTDGVVSKLSVHVGQLLSPGQPIAELVPVETYVVANFKETQIGHMQPGQEADIEVDALGGHHFTGIVESLSGGTGSRFSLLPPDNASGNFVKVVQRVPVRIKWSNLPNNLEMRAGLSTTVTVHTMK